VNTTPDFYDAQEREQAAYVQSFEESAAQDMAHSTSGVMSAPVAPPTWWQTVMALVWPTAEQVAATHRQRLASLDATIQRYPESPSAYLLRAELALEQGLLDLAESDFRRAQTLASAEAHGAVWGMVGQAVQDRAVEGLAQVARRRLR
jgi:hypothetical protein